MKMKKITFSLLAGIAASSLLLTSCVKKNKNSPGFEFMPDMYRSLSYKAGETNPVFADGKTNQDPVDGTIPFSFDRSKIMNVMPYAYPNTPGGRDSAALFLKNPLLRNDDNVAEGKRLYDIYCVVCHGKTGAGDGSVVKITTAKDNYGLVPPAYNSDQLKGISEGQIFHATQWGKGNMGSYASQLSVEERWKIVFYVQDLQKGGAAPTDSTKSDSTATAKK